MSKQMNIGSDNLLFKISLLNEPFQIGKLYHNTAPVFVWKDDPGLLTKIGAEVQGRSIPTGSHLLFIGWSRASSAAMFLFEDKKVWVMPGAAAHIFRGQYQVAEITDAAPDEQ